MVTKPLSRDEFWIALKRGQGRALQHIIQYGLEEYQDLVIEACLHNQNYDSQIDSSRAPWLFSMFRDTSLYSKFQAVILENVENSSSWDLIQLCDLLREMSEAGDDLARQKLKDIVFEYAAGGSEDEHIIVEEFIDLQNAEELLDLARIFGNRLLNNPDDFPFEGLIPEKKKQAYIELIYQSAQQDAAIKAYVTYLEERGYLESRILIEDRVSVKNNLHEHARKILAIGQILEDAKRKKGKIPGRYVTFGMHATEEELQRVFALLMSETDPEVQVRLLWVFRRAPLPEINLELLIWANSENSELRWAAISALAQRNDIRIHELILDKLKRGEFFGPDNEVFSLFCRNYEKSDARLITEVLTGISPSDDDAHAIGDSLIELFEAQRDSNLQQVLSWVYETTPCTFCRYKAISQLKLIGNLDAQIIEECYFDANEDIRRLMKTSE